jgi:hypothetical protein
VRETSASCITIGWPSDDSRTSSSTTGAPSSIAASNAGSVFSGCVDDAPR